MAGSLIGWWVPRAMSTSKALCLPADLAKQAWNTLPTGAVLVPSGTIRSTLFAAIIFGRRHGPGRYRLVETLTGECFVKSYEEAAQIRVE